MDSVIRKTIVGLWLLTCIFFTVDTGLFVDPSLSQTLLGGICALLMCIMGLIYGVITKAKWPIHKGTILVIVWIAYIFIHAYCIENAEQYKMFYFVVGLILLLTLSFFIQNRLICFRQIENGLLLMVLLQLLCLVLQTLGIRGSDNTYFSLTGFGDNPNTVCILIAVCIPLLFDRLKDSQHSKALLLIIVLSIVYLLVLKCRTAIVGLLVICSIRLAFTMQVRNWLKGFDKKKMYIIGVLTIITAALFATALYKMKKDSADGRLLIWKISANMIAEKPLGWGVGMFEKTYNLCQGEYFASNKGSESERTLADVVRMAYNDYLEQGVETGLPGAILLSSFYLILIVKAYKNKRIKALSTICGFAVMSTVSFVYSTIQAWIVLISFGAYVLSDTKKVRTITSSIVVSTVCVSVCCLLLIRYCELAYSQMELHNYESKFENKEFVELDEINKLKTQIGTSEAFYSFLGDVQLKNKNYHDALCSFQKASLYTTDSKLFFSIFNCCDKLGKTVEGIVYIKKISNIVPQNMMSRNILLKWYDHVGMYQKALEMAHDITDTKLKVTNPRSIQYQQGAKYYIDNHERNSLNIYNQKIINK